MVRADKIEVSAGTLLNERVGMPKLVGPVAQRVAVIGRHDFAVGADGGEDDEVAAGAERADFGHFRRTEAARERKLALVGHVLAAKHQNRMFLEGRARRSISGIVCGDIGERDAAQLGGKARTQRDDFHRRISPALCVWPSFLQNRAGWQCALAALPLVTLDKPRRQLAQPLDIDAAGTRDVAHGKSSRRELHVFGEMLVPGRRWHWRR